MNLMQPLPPKSSTILLTVRLARLWMKLTLASVLFVLACAGILYGWVVPHIDSLRPRLEAYVSQQIGQTVQIGRITAQSGHLLPSFELNNVRLLDVNSQPKLQLQQIVVHVSALSLLTLNIDQLIIEAPELDITRDANNQWRIAGFLLNAKGDTGTSLDWLFSQKEIIVRNGTLHWHDKFIDNTDTTFRHIALTLTNGARSHQVQLDATPPADWGLPLQLVGESTQPLLETHAGHWQAWSGSITLKGKQLQMDAFALLTKAAGKSLPVSEPLGGQINQFNLSLQHGSHSQTQVRLQTDIIHPDITGTLDATWQEKSGSLDMHGAFSRIDLTALHRYLPSSLSQPTRQYLEHAIQRGVLTETQLVLRGALKDFPFTKPNSGEFRFQGKIADGQFLADPLGVWPELTQINTSFDLHGLSLAFNDVHTIFAGMPVRGSVHLADLSHPVIEVKSEASGSLLEWMALVQKMPNHQIPEQILGYSESTGKIIVKLNASLPLNHMHQSTVIGSAQLLGENHTLASEFLIAGDHQHVSGNGVVDAKALLAWKDLPIKGRTAYNFLWDADSHRRHLIIESNLAGLQLNFPAPFNKTSQADPQVFHFEQTTLMEEKKDHIIASLAGAANMEWTRDPHGSQANIQFEQLDPSAWGAFLPMTDSNANAPPFMPTSITAEINQLDLGNRSFGKVKLEATKTGSIWHITTDAKNIKGHAEFHPANNQHASELYARLSKLSLPEVKNSATPMDALSRAPSSSMPALNIMVDDFELASKKLGRVEILAINHKSKEWELKKLLISNSDATLKATGSWLANQVHLAFNLDVADSGQLLSRLDMPGTIKDGKGQLQGHVAWLGSPLTLDYPSLTGDVQLTMSKGQFLKVDPGKAGRFLGVLSLQALPRLLTLDFRDVFSEGFAFDSLSGNAQIHEGVLTSQNLQMKSVLALVSLEGSVDLAKETQNLHVLVLPDINAGGVSVLAALVNPVVGATTYLAQLVLRRPVIAAATKEFEIEGSWQNPKVNEMPKP